MRLNLLNTIEITYFCAIKFLSTIAVTATTFLYHISTATKSVISSRHRITISYISAHHINTCCENERHATIFNYLKLTSLLRIFLRLISLLKTICTHCLCLRHAIFVICINCATVQTITATSTQSSRATRQSTIGSSGVTGEKSEICWTPFACCMNVRESTLSILSNFQRKLQTASAQLARVEFENIYLYNMMLLHRLFICVTWRNPSRWWRPRRWQRSKFSATFTTQQRDVLSLLIYWWVFWKSLIIDKHIV